MPEAQLVVDTKLFVGIRSASKEQESLHASPIYKLTIHSFCDHRSLVHP